MPVGRVAVPKTGKSIGTLPFLDRSAGRSSHGDCSEVPVGKVAVPKTGQKTPSTPRDASGAPVGLLSVPTTGQKDGWARDNLYPDGPARFPCSREHTPL